MQHKPVARHASAGDFGKAKRQSLHRTAPPTASVVQPRKKRFARRRQGDHPPVDCESPPAWHVPFPPGGRRRPIEFEILRQDFVEHDRETGPVWSGATPPGAAGSPHRGLGQWPADPQRKFWKSFRLGNCRGVPYCFFADPRRSSGMSRRADFGVLLASKGVYRLTHRVPSGSKGQCRPGRNVLRAIQRPGAAFRGVNSVVPAEGWGKPLDCEFGIRL